LRHQPGTGSFLIANPALVDPNFSRTVVLLCEHDEQGSMGLVINRPGELSLHEALTDLGPSATQPLLWGGPVQRDIVLVLHRDAPEISGARPVGDGMSLGGDQEELLELLRGPESVETRVRVFSGYAGWGEGQLEAELRARGWIVCPARARFVFEVEPAAIWAEVLRSLGPRYAHLAAMPSDPRVN